MFSNYAETTAIRVNGVYPTRNFEPFRSWRLASREGTAALHQVADGQDTIAALFLLPAGDKGRSTLRLGDNTWLNLPNAGRPVRITSLQSVVGGVFNNADILRLDYSTDSGLPRAEAAQQSRVAGCRGRAGLGYTEPQDGGAPRHDWRTSNRMTSPCRTHLP